MGERDSDDSRSGPRKREKTSSEVTDNPDLGGAAEGDGASGTEKSADSPTSDRSSKSPGGSTGSRGSETKRGGSS